MTTEQLARRWQRSPRWTTEQARAGQIPGAWKVGRLWRFDIGQIEAYEVAQQSENIFALTPLAAVRQRNREKRDSRIG